MGYGLRITVLVASASSGALSTWAAPEISRSAVYNNASYAADGALNRGIAQGSVFAIFGKGLGPSALVQVQSFPLQRTLAGVSVRVTIFGSSIDAYPIYVSEGQIGVMMPSATEIGSGTVTVSYQGETSAPEPITVVRRSFGAFTLNQAGSGPAIVQNFISESQQPLNTLLTPARPGQTVILWGTGLGPVGANEIDGPAPGDFNAGITVYVGGVVARLRYSGRSGCCASIDQLVFDVPETVQGCYVPVQVVGSGLLSTRENATIPINHTVSNSVTISVAPASQPACTDPQGLTGVELTALQKAGTARVGAFFLTRRPFGTNEATQDLITCQFSKVDAAGFLRSRGIFGLPSAGSCLQFQLPSGDMDARDPARGSSLDAGGAVTISGPGGEKQVGKNAAGEYATSLGDSYLQPGSHTLSSPGGSDLAAFQASFTVPAPPQWTNRNPDAYAQTFNPNFQWSLNGPADYVIASAYGRNDLTAFYTICTEDPAKRSFTIPSYAYAGLVLHTTSAPGVIWIGAGMVSRFTATGLDLGLINVISGGSGVFIP